MQAGVIDFEVDGARRQVGTEDDVQAAQRLLRGAGVGAWRAREEEARVYAAGPGEAEAGHDAAAGGLRAPNAQEALPLVQQVRDLVDHHHVAVEGIAQPLELARQAEDVVGALAHLVIVVLCTEERRDRVHHDQSDRLLLHEDRQPVEQHITLPLQCLWHEARGTPQREPHCDASQLLGRS